MAGVVVRLIGSLVTTLVAYGVYRVAKFIYDEFTSPWRDLPGPKSSNFVLGHLKDLYEAVRNLAVYTLAFDTKHVRILILRGGSMNMGLS
jgi:hypothetical protein